MPTLRTVTVKSAGGDYTSLSSAEAGEQADLPSLDRQLDIECYAFSDTSAVTISGWTTDATRYVRVVAPVGQRHSGVWSTSAYRLVVPNANVLVVGEEYVRLEYLQIHHSASSAGFQDAIEIGPIAAGGSDIRIDGCIVRQAGNATVNEICIYIGDADATVSIRNSIAYGDGGVGSSTSAVWAEAGTVSIENCTLISASAAIRRTAGTTTAKNVYAHGVAGSEYVGTMTLTTCAHSSATSFTGSTASIAHSTANFTNVTAGSEDYHLVGGASATLLTGGTDLSGTFTTDIDGQTRVDWGIGADEYIASGPVIPVFMCQYRQRCC